MPDQLYRSTANHKREKINYKGVFRRLEDICKTIATN